MAGESTYQIIEIVGTSKTSWEEAAKIAEVVKLDMVVEDGKVSNYRAKINLSFKYHGEE